MSMQITNVDALAIQDSRGRPTLRVTVSAGEHTGAFDVPSGASTGSREAHELRDPDGGVENALRAIREAITPALLGKDVTDQKAIDEIMLALDGTPQKKVLGGNSTIGVSVAALRAAASVSGTELHAYIRSTCEVKPSRETPRLFVNLINGGKHAEGGSPVQEHQIVTDAPDPALALKHASVLENALHERLRTSNITFQIGDEGGVVFPVKDAVESFSILGEIVEASGLGADVALGADIAASSFYEEGAYQMLGRSYSSSELVEFYASLAAKGLRFIEDPFHEDDMADFARLQGGGFGLSVIGDDLTTTSADSIAKAAEAGAIESVIIKPNQIGTVTETLNAMRAARERGVHCIVSHRSGETMDAFITDLAFGTGAFGLKAGAPSAPHRAIKYTRLVEIAHGR